MSDPGTALLIVGPDGFEDQGVTYPPGAIYGRILLEPGVPYDPPPGFILGEDGGEVLHAPATAEPVPASVEAWQLRIAMLNTPSKMEHANKSVLDDANALATSVGGATLIAWLGAPLIDRASPTIASMAPALNLSSADIDAIFVAATKVAM